MKVEDGQLLGINGILTLMLMNILNTPLTKV